MSRFWILQLLGIGLLGIQACSAQGPTYSTVEEAQKDEDFARQGEYEGDDTGWQVVALGDHKFMVVKFDGGLPGAGGEDREVVAESATWDQTKEHLGDAKRVERKSPTLGKKEDGATVLFDGTEESLKNWQDGASMTDDGLLKPQVISKEKFNDYSMHIEFLLPYMPEARGQGRGNSGNYIQGRYELQMLDSFGLEGKDNECGGIYQIAEPDVNMCFPPLAWQTYDFDFTAAKFDKEGNKTDDAHVTIKHNGVVIHDDLVLPHATPGGTSGETPEPGPILLQDHHNPVRYRNIWVVKH